MANLMLGRGSCIQESEDGGAIDSSLRTAVAPTSSGPPRLSIIFLTTRGEYDLAHP
jgi:hypothetical protein